jgi:hypothetical protein
MNDEYMTAKEVAHYCKSQPSPKTIHEWSKRGVVFNGVTIFLRRIREGAKFVFKRSDVDEFLGRFN